MKYGISFDFWNTLYGEELESERYKLRISYFHKALTSNNGITFENVEAAFSSSMQDFVHEWKFNHRTPRAVDRIKQIAGYLRTNLSKETVEKIADFYGNLIFKLPPQELKDVKRIIPELADKYPLGIISDTGYTSGKYIRSFLEQEGLLKYFNSLIFSDEQDNSKPHESVFKSTCSNLGIKFPNLIHIGDLERTDIEGAINAGCKCIRFIGAKPVEDKDSKANFVTYKYIELPEIIERLIVN